MKLLIAFLLSVSFLGSAYADLVDSFDSENGGNGALNYDAFANFQVTSGSVDLTGTGFFDLYPGNGLYVDLNGTSGVSGVLETTVEFPPGTYKLSFRIGNNSDGTMNPNTVDVSLGDFSETFVREGADVPLALVERDVVISTNSRLIFSTPASDPDSGGIIIDSVSVICVQAVPLLGDVNLDGSVTFADIAPFIAILQGGTFLAEADVNQDGVVDFADIPAFIAILQAG